MQAAVRNGLEIVNSSIPCPANYVVAGSGGGETGFTTQSDIGPAHVAVVRATSSWAIGLGGRGKKDAEVKGYDEDRNFDEFEGNEVRLFASGEYDEKGKEAEVVWDDIDKRMDSRRKNKRLTRLKDEIDKYHGTTPKITKQFADLKRILETISYEEWDSIPDIGDYSYRNKKKRFESYVPLPE